MFRLGVAAAIGVGLAILAMPAQAQRVYGPGVETPDAYRVPPPTRLPQPPREPQRPRPQGGHPGGYGPLPGFGVMVAPPLRYREPPPRVIYDAPELRPSSRPKAAKPAPPKPAVAKPAATKPAAPKQQAARPSSRPPPSRTPPASAARGAARAPVVAALPDRVPDEVVFELRADNSEAEINAVLRRFALTPLSRTDIALLGTSVQRARVARGSNVSTVLRQLTADPRVASAQPNHLFDGQAEAAPQETSAPAAEPEFAAAQYAPAKMQIDQAHQSARGRDVLVAVIDSAVDPAHPELVAALVEAAAGDPPGVPHAHGTAMAGAIAAHVKLIGIAPAARILALDALRYDPAGGARGTTMDILVAFDRAASLGARVVNLSFAGPRDDLMGRALRALSLRGTVLVAAVGNAGPKAKPLYPAAYPDVIAVTATDAQDRLYSQAVLGPQVALAAPGVEIMVPAPAGTYQVLSGTSLASAEVAGIAALLLERNPALTAEAVRAALVATARDLGKAGRDDQFGAGLVDAAAALRAVATPALPEAMAQPAAAAVPVR